MSETKLLPCPICDKEVSVALMGGEQIQWWSITRGIGKEKDRCTCRFFFESLSFSPDDPQEEKEAKKQRMIERWNTRKPIERIAERLEEVKTKGYVTGITANPYEFGACNAMDRAIAIVKEEGGIT